MYINRIITCIAIVALSATMATSAFSQTKAQKKLANTEYKRYVKEGWKTKPGTLPLLRQLEIVQELLEKRDDSGYSEWISAEASSRTTVYNAGKSSAILLSKNNLGLLIETELVDEIAAKIINEDQGELDSETVERVKHAITGRMAKVIGRVQTIMECYRELGGGKTEVLVRVAMKRIDAINLGVKVYKDNHTDPDPTLTEEENNAEPVPQSSYLRIDWLTNERESATKDFAVKVGINTSENPTKCYIKVKKDRYGFQMDRGTKVVKKDGYNMVLTKTITLKSELNELIFYVKIGGKLYRSESFYVKYKPNGARNPKDQNIERRIALVIGNSNYSQDPLRNPRNDATDIAAKLGSLGFDVIRGFDVNKKSFKDKIREFEEKSNNYDVALFYYAGHGMQTKGINYLIPVDADIKVENEIASESISANEVLTKLEESQCQAKIVILDACRNNPFERSWHRGIKSRGLSIMEGPKGTLIAYATNPGDVANDGEGNNSPYTKALLKMLDIPELSLETFFKEVGREVTEKTRGAQTPWTTSSFIGDFYFNRQQ